MTPARQSGLNQTLMALADPTRRAILQRLSRGEARVTELALPFAMSLNAVSVCWRARDSCGGDGQGGSTCCPSIRNHSMEPRRGLRDKERGGPPSWTPSKPYCWQKTEHSRKQRRKRKDHPDER